MRVMPSSMRPPSPTTATALSVTSPSPAAHFGHSCCDQHIGYTSTLRQLLHANFRMIVLISIVQLIIHKLTLGEE